MKNEVSYSFLFTFIFLIIVAGAFALSGDETVASKGNARANDTTSIKTTPDYPIFLS